MVVDWRADHSFRSPRPDLTAEFGVPNACSQAGCHADRPLVVGARRVPRPGTAKRASPALRHRVRRRARRTTGLESDLRRIADGPLQPVIVRATAL